MTPDELAKRQERAATEPLVITAIDGGFRVHSPTGQSRPYMVSGTPESPACSCPDFQTHPSDPEWRCKHILAALSRSGGDARSPSPSADSYEREERRAIQEEAGAPAPPANDASHMLIKRSVSPDGRIDSMSIEFSCPVEIPETEIEARAAKFIALQDQIADRFLNGDGSERREPPSPPAPNGESVAAELLDVGGMDTQWGRRLFLRVRVNGDVLLRFGSQSQLSDCISEAGFPELAGQLAEGLELNQPCRVTTKLSNDGRYVNVDQLLPAAAAAARSMGWS